MTLLMIPVFLIIFFLSTADSATLYVSPSGGNTTCAKESPCSLSRGLDRAKRGDTVQFTAGTFNAQLNTEHDGVTFIGAPGHKTKFVWPGSGNGNHIVGIRHDDIRIRGIVVDGEKKAGQGHGLVRFYSSKNVTFEYNKVLNSKGTLVSIGGSVPGSKIREVDIFANDIMGAGFGPKFGECIYVGSNESGRDFVQQVRIIGNRIQDCADNVIDLKKSASRVEMKYNDIKNQVERTRTKNHGTLVAQGHSHLFRDNVIQDVVGGTAVFNLVHSGNINVEDNIISGVTKTLHAVRSRGSGGMSSPTFVVNNLFCDTPTKSVVAPDGLSVSNNAGLDKPTVDCRPRIETLLAEIEKIRQEAPVEPEPEPVELPEIVVHRMTYGALGDNVVRVYVRTIDESDAQMHDRDFVEGSVAFAKQDGTELSFRRQKPSKPGREPGWTFYLTGDYPRDQGIRMVADQGWITGAPGFDEIVLRHGVEPTLPDPDPDPEPEPEPEPDPVRHLLTPGDLAICPDSVGLSQTEIDSGMVTLIRCGS